MSAEATLFGSTSEAPTVPLSNARVLLSWGESGLTVFFHSSDSRIRAAHSQDGGITWVPPYDVAIDGTEQFSCAFFRGMLHLLYVTPLRGLKHMSLPPGQVPVGLPESEVLYMNHSETGEPSFPCICSGTDGAMHAVCSFTSSSGWSVLYRGTEADGWTPWQVVDSGDGASPSYASLAVTADAQVHVVYRIFVGGRFHLFHRYKTGAEWTDAVQLTFSSAHNGTPSLDADGLELHAAWARSEGARSALIYRKWSHGTWGGETRLADYRDSDANFPTLSAVGGSVVVAWESGQSLVCKSSGDSGANWSAELTILPDGGARYPKASSLAATAPGSVVARLAWSRGIQSPWATAGGVDVAVIGIDVRKGAIESMVIGAPTPALAESGIETAARAPKVRFVDVKSETVRRDGSPEAGLPAFVVRADATWRTEYEERLQAVKFGLEELTTRMSALEQKQKARGEEVLWELGQLRSGIAALDQKWDVLVRRSERPGELRVTPLGLNPASTQAPAPPRQARESPSTSTVRFKAEPPPDTARFRGGDKPSESSQSSSGLSKFFGTKGQPKGRR